MVKNIPNLSKNLLLLPFLFLSFYSFGQSPTNLGFEDGTLTTPTSWTQQTTAAFPNSTDLYIRYEIGSRTGSWNLFLNTGVNLFVFEEQSSGTVSVPNNTYVHVLGWAKTQNNGDTSNMSVGIWMNSVATGGAKAPIPAGDGQPYFRATHNTQNTSGATQNASARILTQRNGGPGANRNYQWDDIVMYTSNSDVTDIWKPVAATNFIRGTTDCNSISFAWTNGSDAETGVQGTYILRTTILSAIPPELNDQGQYSTSGGVNGPNVIGDWTIISTSVSVGSTTYNDNTAANGTQYKYAVVHRDLAYNYSVALVSGTILITQHLQPLPEQHLQQDAALEV